MTTRTSITSGLWSVTGTWGTTIPADDDVVIIQTGTVVEFDADMSNAGTWPNGIDGLTVNASGTLKLTRTAGTYYLKIKAAKTITGAGTFDCGTSGDAIPFAAKHTITGGAAWYINGAGGLTMTVYAAEPAIKTIYLTALEPIGETVLAVDTDVTGDIWADGDTIRIDDINQAAESEERIIAAGGRAAGSITITVGLTAAKSIGALLHLVTRNVKFIGVGATGQVCVSFAAGKLTVAGGAWNSASYRIFNGCVFDTFSGGIFHGAGNCFFNCSDSTVSGGIFTGMTSVVISTPRFNITGGFFSGNSPVANAASSIIVSGGTFKGNTNVIYSSFGVTISGGTFSNNGGCAVIAAGLNVSGGTFSNNGVVINSASGNVKNAVFGGNTYDLQVFIGSLFNVDFGGTTDDYQYNTLSRVAYAESIDHDATAGAFKSWTRGGVTSSQAVTKPTGYTQANQTVLESATSEGFWQKEVLVAAGASVNITMNLRKDAAMTYLPRCIIFNKAAADPFAGGAGIHTFTMTDSVDTWEAETYTYSNNTANDITIVIRFLGENASGNMFSALTVDVLNVDLTTALANIAIIDGIVDAIKLKTDNLPSDPADESLIEAAIAAIPTAPTVDNILDEPVEGAYTLRQAMRIMLASLAGKATGGGTATIIFRDINDSADRITATVDINGNRSVVALDVT